MVFFSFGNVFKTMQVRSICIPPICQLLLKVIHIFFGIDKLDSQKEMKSVDILFSNTMNNTCDFELLKRTLLPLHL